MRRKVGRARSEEGGHGERTQPVADMGEVVAVEVRVWGLMG